MTTSDQPLPRASVIVPVRNSPQSLDELLEDLARQTYPGDRFEVIVSDNGSTDRTGDVVLEWKERFPAKLERVDASARRGSYAARNAGLAHATGEVFAFIDADCRPDPDWLLAGIRTLEREDADLAGGQVLFTWSDPPTGAEVADSRTNMQMEADIQMRGVTKTANLFARREVFARIGEFPGHLQSGGDVWWTGKATRAGCRLVFAAEAVVRHPARSWRALFKKQIRVGRGQIPAMREAGMSGWDILAESFELRDRRKTFQPQSGQAKRDLPVPEWKFQAAIVWSRTGTLLGRVLYLVEHGLRKRGPDGSTS